jgi:hypothetical protein
VEEVNIPIDLKPFPPSPSIPESPSKMPQLLDTEFLASIKTQSGSKDFQKKVKALRCE